MRTIFTPQSYQEIHPPTSDGIDSEQADLAPPAIKRGFVRRHRRQVPQRRLPLPGRDEVGVGGKGASAHVRERNTVPGGDSGRVKRQQNFLRSMMTKIMTLPTNWTPQAIRWLAASLSSRRATVQSYSRPSGDDDVATFVYANRDLTLASAS